MNNVMKIKFLLIAFADLVQEQVAWFHEKGSPTARAKVTVVR